MPLPAVQGHVVNHLVHHIVIWELATLVQNLSAPAGQSLSSRQFGEDSISQIWAEWAEELLTATAMMCVCTVRLMAGRTLA